MTSLSFDFEKLNFPFPRKLTCYEEKTCETKVDTLFKSVNINAMKEFPEVLNFLSMVRLSTPDVNAMIAESNKYDNSSA